MKKDIIDMNFDNVISNFKIANKSKTKYAGNVKCEDAVWGKIKKGIISQYNRNDIDGKTFPQKKLSCKNVLIIVAESPHTAEYKFHLGKIEYKSPLHRCDKRILKHLKALLGVWIDKKKNYDVILINAIQYQCSFGLPLWKCPKNQKQKNDVFRFSWHQENGEKDLLSRVTTLIKKKNEVIILNACTKALKPECNASIFNKGNYSAAIKIYDEKHPSKW